MQSNIARLLVVQVPYNPGGIGANSVLTDGANVAIPGLRSSDLILAAIKPTLTANLAPVGARAVADGQAIVTFVNSSAGSIDAPAEIWTFVIASPDQGMLPSTALT